MASWDVKLYAKPVGEKLAEVSWLPSGNYVLWYRNQDDETWQCCEANANMYGIRFAFESGTVFEFQLTQYGKVISDLVGVTLGVNINA